MGQHKPDTRRGAISLVLATMLSKAGANTVPRFPIRPTHREELFSYFKGITLTAQDFESVGVHSEKTESESRHESYGGRREKEGVRKRVEKRRMLSRFLGLLHGEEWASLTTATEWAYLP